MEELEVKSYIPIPEIKNISIDSFKKNPVLTYNYDHSKIIGKVKSIIVDDSGIKIEVIIIDPEIIQTIIKPEGCFPIFNIATKHFCSEERLEELVEVSLLDVNGN